MPIPTSKPVRLSPPRVLLHCVNAQGASGLYRLSAPGDALRRTGFATTLVNYRVPKTAELDILAPDTIVQQHFFTDAGIEAAKTYRKRKGLFTAFEMDDLFWDMDDSNPNKATIPTDVLTRLRKTSAMADVAIVSTPRLAEHVKKSLGFTDDRIRIVRNMLPQAFITAALSSRPKRTEPLLDARPRVGWAGGISHPGDLAILKEVVENTYNKIQWVFMGSMPDVPKGMVEYHDAVRFTLYPGKLASLDLDLAVAPLADTEFNACKSDLRVLEYAACGYPVLASKSAAFADTNSALLTVSNNDPQTWVKAIYDFFGIDGLADTHAQELHDWVKAERVIESRNNLKRWAWAWTPESQNIFEPVINPLSDESIVIVGEPLYTSNPTYQTIKEARIKHPGASIICVRSGCVPTEEQIAVLEESTGNALSSCVMSNDGDYPAPGRFIPLAGKTMRDMEEAALNVTPHPGFVQVPYPTGPVIRLSARALDAVGIPDEERYGGDTELAIIDWTMRLRDMDVNGHITLPRLFVPVHSPGRISTNTTMTEKAIKEISTWHRSFEGCREETATAEALFVEARRAIDLAYARLSYEAPACNDYPEWTNLHDTWTPAAKAWAENKQASFSNNTPILSIIMPAYNTPVDLLTAAVDSVIAQEYPHWQLIIVDDASTNANTINWLKTVEATDSRIVVIFRETNGHISAASNSGLERATGEWTLFLDHDDTIPPYALLVLAGAIVENPDASLFYGDSDMIAPDGKMHSPDFKPGFDYDLLLAQNYIRGCYKTETVKRIGGFRTEFDGSQDYDLLLRYLEEECWKTDRSGPIVEHIVHIPLVVYHWRQSPDSVSSSIANKPYAIEAAHQAVLTHLQRVEKNAFVGQHPAAPLHNLVRFLPSSPLPKASIIILTQMDRNRLENCLSSILTRTAYGNYEIIVRQVGDDPGLTDTIKLYAKRDPRIKYIRGGGHAGTFNFALLNNAAVECHIASDSEVLVFLNDDTEIVEGAWLNDLVGTAMRPDVGAVGVKLVYSNGQVQHNGIYIDLDAPRGEYALHAQRGIAHNDPGGFARAVLAHQVAAVTGACLAIQREVFISVGKFDAQQFPLDYNDVDLCLRLLKNGYVNVVLSHVGMIHHEGGTKRANSYQVNRAGMEAAEALCRSLHSEMQDPYRNPNLEHHPSNAAVKMMPPRPWRTGSMPRILAIGADKADAHTIFLSGELPIRADGDGPWLRLTEPVCEQGGIVDLRDKAWQHLIADLDIQRVMLRRLGASSADTLLGALSDIGNAGMPLDYQAASFESVCPRLDCTNSGGPCGHKWKTGVEECQACVDRDGSPYGSVSIVAWHVVWKRFRDAMEASKEAKEDTNGETPELILHEDAVNAEQ